MGRVKLRRRITLVSGADEDKAREAAGELLSRPHLPNL